MAPSPGRAPASRARAAAVLLLAALIGVSYVEPIRAQGSGPEGVPRVLSLLDGEWVGEGVLLGRPGAFTMVWTLRPGGFARLSYTNAWVEEGGASTPVLAAEATYLVRGATAMGVWIDDRPQRLELTASVSDSALVTSWTAPTERGRTEYVVQSPASVVARDFVLVDGGERLFAEATYRRP